MTVSRFVPWPITMKHEYPWAIRDMNELDDVIVFGFYRTEAEAVSAIAELAGEA